MAVRLVDGTSELELGAATGYAVAEVDLGFPEVRRVADNRPQADGTIDRSQYHGARTVSLDVSVWKESATSLTRLVDDLRAFCRPGARPWLVFDADGSERMIRLAVDQQSAPITNPVLRKVRAQWVAPDGRIYATTEKVRAVNPGTEGETGRTYNLTFNRTYPFSGGPGSLAVTNDGTTVTEPVLRIFGPCTDPIVINDTVGKRLKFVGLSIAGGEYVEVDVANRTVRSNGLTDPGFNRYRYLDFVVSEWWGIEPGRNVLRFQAATWSVPSQVEVLFRSAWL